jgi:hypothetical protein
MVFGATVAVACGCGDDARPEADPPEGPVWLDDVENELPRTLSEVGVFADPASLALSARAVAYEPNWPLWSNGTDKLRALFVPEGAIVEPSGSSWEFPIGTVLAKTFGLGFDADDTTPVETRLIFRRNDRWEYAAYVWTDDRKDAELLEGNWGEVTMNLRDESGDAFSYKVPARLDCRTCHETSEKATRTPVLGVSALQLPPSLEHAPFFAERPPLSVVAGRSDAETRALGYFVGNCISCHHGGDGDNSAFSLYPDVAIENTVGKPTEISSAEGIRVVPGAPEESVLFITVVRAPEPSYAGPFKAMPPLAITRADPSAGAILGDWIAGL